MLWLLVPLGSIRVYKIQWFWMKWFLKNCHLHLVPLTHWGLIITLIGSTKLKWHNFEILSLVEVSNILLTIICHTLAHVSSTKHDMNIKHFCSRANSSAVSKVQTLLHKICNLKYFYILYLYIINIYCFPKE